MMAGVHGIIARRVRYGATMRPRTNLSLGKDTPTRARSYRRQPVGSLPFQKSADYTTATTTSPRAVGPRSQLQAVVPPLPPTVLYCAELLPLSAVSRPLSRLRRGLTRASHANKLVAMLLNRVADMVERHAVASILVVQERHSHARSISKNCATPQSAAGLRVLLVLRWCRVTSAFWITSGRRFPLNLRDVHFGQGWPQQRPFKNGHPLFSRWRFVFR